MDVPSSRPASRRPGGHRHASSCLLAFLLLAGPGVPRIAAQAAAPAAVVHVAGGVTDRIAGQPIAGVLVRARTLDSGYVARTLTDSVGVFRLEVPAHQAIELVLSRAGFASARVPVENPSEPVLVSLMPRPTELRSISVSYNRLIARARAVPYATMTWEGSELQLSTASDALTFVRRRLALPILGCGSELCTIWRGRRIVPHVFIDDVPAVGGLDQLQLVPTDELYRVEVYRDGWMIRVYTEGFVARLVRTGQMPIPMVW